MTVIKWILIRGLIGLALALAAAAAVPVRHVVAPDEAPAELSQPVLWHRFPTGAPPVREVRVLIAGKCDEVELRAEEGVVFRDADDRVVARGDAGDWTAVKPGPDGGLAVADDGRHSSLWASPTLDGATLFVRTRRDGRRSETYEYFGRLQLLPGDRGLIDLINHVDVERYVACVTCNEVWPTFHADAFRGQAIVARTYVLYQMLRRNAADFDVSATQGSQVYRGVQRDRAGRRAAAAAQYTRGVALTWPDGGTDRLFCAYYSAACGGRSQSAAIFGPAGDVAPLAGGVVCDYCRIAPGKTYRWGPERFKKRTVYERLTAADPELAALGGLRRAEVSQTTSDGRAIAVRLAGENGASPEVLAERFRLAVDPMLIRSTHFEMEDGGDELIFKNGRGFGHGLGLCQWGMQAQAREGRSVSEILQHYYPGSRLTRVY